LSPFKVKKVVFHHQTLALDAFHDVTSLPLSLRTSRNNTDIPLPGQL